MQVISPTDSEARDSQRGLPPLTHNHNRAGGRIRNVQPARRVIWSIAAATCPPM